MNMRLWFQGLAVKWVYRIMRLEPSADMNASQVVVVQHWPKGWSMAVQDANPNLNVWYGPGPVPVGDWSLQQLKRYVSDNGGMDVDE